MGEKTGFMTVLMIFAIGLLPILFTTFTNHVEGSKILNISTEFQQLVSAEGGVTPKVNEAKNKLENAGMTITLNDQGGNPVTGKVDVGEQIHITYQYKGFKTENTTTVLRR